MNMRGGWKWKKGIALMAVCGLVGSQMACGTGSVEDENTGTEMTDQREEFSTESSEGQAVTESDGSVQENEKNESTSETKVYEKNGFLAENTELLNERMLEKAGKHFTTLYEKYLQPNGIEPYFAIIPDKNYYLTETDAIEAEFDEMAERLCSQCGFMQYIELRELLELEDYYHTDSHWKQECIVDVAEYLCEKMGNPMHAEYETKQVDTPFRGSYYKDIETTLEPDEVKYLTNESLVQCKVSKFEGMEPEAAELYDMKKAASDNPYDMFLGGAVPIITVENPNAENGKKLILFRDSFGSSIAPLLVPGYQTVTLVDIRYVQSGLVGNFVDFADADVLFLYSSILLNNSAGMK